MTNFLDSLLNAPAWAVLAVTGAVVFLEDAIFVGFLVPGETAAVLGGVAASQGHVALWAVMLVVVVAAIAGDSVGYEVGRHFGPRLLELRMLSKHRGRIDEARSFLARRGGVAVLLGRWVAFFRAVMPALAGASRMPYPKFLVFNATGGAIWGVAVVLLGYLAGASYQHVERVVGRGALIGLAIVALLGLAAWHARKAHHSPDSPSHGS